MDEMNLANHVVPALGSRKVREVTHAEIVRVHQRIGTRAPGAANRVLALLSKMFNLAEKWGLRESGTNPCRRVVKYRERKIERYVAPDEYERLEAVLTAAETEGRLHPAGALAFRLLMLTGCRLGEVLALRWGDIDYDRSQLILRDGKTGSRRVQLGSNPLELLRAYRTRARPLGWVLPRPGREGERLTADWMWTRWRWIRRRAGVPDLRIHDLRHGFASAGAEEGMSLPMIGALLGHKSPATTARYTHLVGDPLRQAAEQVSRRISLTSRADRSA